MPSSTNFVFLAEQVFVADPNTTQFVTTPSPTTVAPSGSTHCSAAN